MLRELFVRVAPGIGEDRHGIEICRRVVIGLARVLPLLTQVQVQLVCPTLRNMHNGA
jgi:hypothetical protein